MDLLEEYLREMHEIRASGSAVKETSYYPALSNLLNGVGKGLKPRVHCVINIKNRGAGIPDGGLFSADQLQRRSSAEILPGTIPARGVLEVKGAHEDAWVVADGEQVTRYWGKYRQVLVTNYRDFVLVGQDAEGKSTKLETYRLAPSESLFWKAANTEKATAARLSGSFQEFLNSNVGWRNVPAKVWEYTISGYPVIKKWLSYREKELLGRNLTVEEARYVTDMTRRIAALMMLGPQSDESYHAVAKKPDAWQG
jgi:hypothetical protein